MIRSVISAIFSPLATKLGFWGHGYNATDPRRKIIDPRQLIGQSRATANQLLNGSLPVLRAYCRNLERNNPTARAALEGVVSVVVGTGIALEPDTGDESLDKDMREMFNRWCESCGVGGESMWELQSLAMREIFNSGEMVWRIVYDQEAELRGELPLRILPLDSEWIADDVQGDGKDQVTTVAGIAVDKLGRPQVYFLRNPELTANAEEVPASAVIHCFERRRSTQNRGEPWLAPLIETLLTERDLVDAELKGAVITASLGIAIESDYHEELDDDTADGDPAQSIGLGSIVRLAPGEKVHAFGHTRPSQQIAPFRQMLRGDIAAPLRIPQRYLDRDVSRANYSSMRADMIDTERQNVPVREWFGKGTIARIYKMLVPYMAAKLHRPVPRYDFRLVPDGQPYVDPLKDAQAAILAIEGGLSTYEAEIGKRGGDYRQVWEQIKKEQGLAESLGINPHGAKGEQVFASTQEGANDAAE